MAVATTALSMKLFIDAKARRVVFTEASKAVVDYLHSLLVSPEVSLAFETATSDSCIGHLYDSVEVLNAATRALLRLQPSSEQATKSRFFVCGYKHGAGCAGYVTDARGASCPSCGGEMAAEVPDGSPGAGCSGQSAAADGGADGPVQGVVDMRCLLKDDLTALPTPAAMLKVVSAMAFCLLTGAGACELEEKTVRVGYTEGVEILMESLQSGKEMILDVDLRLALCNLEITN